MRVKPKRHRPAPDTPKTRYVVEIGVTKIETSAFNPRAAASNAIYRYSQTNSVPLQTIMYDIKDNRRHCAVLLPDGTNVRYVDL